ncbi:MAG: glycosyl hydrolase [bacterium]
MRRSTSLLAPLLLAVLVALSLQPAPVRAQGPDTARLEGLTWRLIGPYRGGRSIAVAGSDARPDEYFFGAAGGGLWKTTNGGVDWENVSDGYFTTSSVGAVAVAPSDPDVVYAGMGESCIRGDIIHGDGVYRSDDGGETWSHIGLEETQTISHITVHPDDPDVVYAAALGHVFGPNPERGVFKSTDGGESWERILFVSERAGAVDLSMDPNDPEVLYAATWEAWRTPYSMNSGGPGSRLFKSTDGGKNWSDLTRMPGLPGGTLGRIGVTVSPADPQRVYALVEALDGGLFLSDDGGSTWTLVNDDRSYRQRAWYYTHVYADTRDPDTVYVLNVGFYRSTDAGESFERIGVPHGDNHDLWIAPSDPQRMVNANDGGANVSYDGGESWSEQDIPTAQFYHVTTDNHFPYRAYGAQQDNSTVRILSRSEGYGIGRDDWESTAGGESGYLAPKPDDPEVVFGGSYGGYLGMVNHRTGERRNVNAWPDNPMGWGALELEHRFQWTFPILFSPHDPDLLYTSSQYLMKSTNGGETWKRISPDLTRNDPATLGPSGGPITKDNTAVEYYGTIFAVAESPLRPGIIWTGSDDGLIHLSTDGGGSWQEITPPEKPERALVSIIEPSHFQAGTAYAAVNNYKNDDHTPYIYRTRDFGRTWDLITAGIADGDFVRVVREDPEKEGLLFAGTEQHLYVSFDDGEQWQPLQYNLPVSSMRDIAVKEGDVIVATHGRSFWVLDDISVLRQLADVPGKSRAHLFQPPDAWRVEWGPSPDEDESLGDNPEGSILISYLLGRDADRVRFEVLDARGTEVASLDSDRERGGELLGTGAGFHRFAPPRLQYPSFRTFEGMIMWAAGPRPVPAPPGIYTVRMTVDGQTRERSFRLKVDPRSSSSEEDLVAQWELSMEIVERTNDANDAVVVIRDIKEKADTAVETSGSGELARMAADLKEKLGAVEAEIYQVKNRSGQDPLNYPIKLNNKIAALLGVVQSGDFRPTDQSYEVFAVLSGQLQIQLDLLEEIVDTDLAAFNRQLRSMDMEPIVPVTPGSEGGGAD